MTQGLSPHRGSKQSLLGSRQSLSHYQGQNQEKVFDELLQERNRCDRLRDCLEIEREKNAKLADTSEGEVRELLEQIKERDEQTECLRRRLETIEAEKSQLLREIEHNNERIIKLEKTKHRVVKTGETLNNEHYVHDLEEQLEACRDKEMQMSSEIEFLKNKNCSSGNYPVLKSTSFGGAFKN